MKTIKSFCRGAVRKAQGARRKAQSENTIHAVRKAPCAMRLPLAAGGKVITRSNYTSGFAA